MGRFQYKFCSQHVEGSVFLLFALFFAFFSGSGIPTRPGVFSFTSPFSYKLSPSHPLKMHPTTIWIALSLASMAFAVPVNKNQKNQNVQKAIALNKKYKTLSTKSQCTSGENACVQSSFAQCIEEKFVLQACGPGTFCAALPLDDDAGTTIACTTLGDLEARLGTDASDDDVTNNGTAVTGSTNNGTVPTGANPSTAAPSKQEDPQTSLTLDPRVVSKGFANDGQDVPNPGQVASRTSVNNFINDCLLTPDLPLTNGQQITTGSCNNAPIGVIPSLEFMPSAKFSFPTNGGTVTALQTFTIQLNVRNIELGNFVNAKENYFAAPQQVNNQGQIIGHTHITIDPLPSLDSQIPTDPLNFAYFRGVNDAAVGGSVSVTLDKGLPAGAYRLCTINSSANHQPVIVPVAQHGSLDDCVYFIATAGSVDASATASANALGDAVNGTAGNATVSGTKTAKAGKGKGKGSQRS
ncbi:hypothetical protein C8J56DRAFT_920478 [Mycena floridula]|nr:hypothetical protein C8J56DRAFT_920478 [Mycena floridula]